MERPTTAAAYMRTHSLEEGLSDVVEHVMRERPADPWRIIGEHCMALSAKSKPVAPAVNQWQALSLASVDALIGVLKAAGLDIATWDAAHNAKSPAHLFDEMQQGKCVLERVVGGPHLRRTTQVVGCKLIHGDHLLLASHEVLPSHTADKSALISSKIPGGADWRERVLSTLASELNLNRAELEIDDFTFAETLETESSARFPGLETVYKLCTVEVRMPAGLPSHLELGRPVEIAGMGADKKDPNVQVNVTRVYAWVTIADWDACHSSDASGQATPLRFRRVRADEPAVASGGAPYPVDESLAPSAQRLRPAA